MRMYVPESQFLAVIDMLRNERPISVYHAAGSGFLHTGSEPIGEGNDPRYTKRTDIPRSAGVCLMGACEVGRGPTVFGNARRL